MATKLLLIGDERKNRRMYAWGFANERFKVKLASSFTAVEALLDAESFHAICVDLKMQEADPTAFVERVHERVPEVPIIALVGERERKLAALLREYGVCAQLMTPFAFEELHAVIRTHALTEPVAIEKSGRETPAITVMPSVSSIPRLMANDETAQRTLELALRAANSSAAILILGETGTGKSLLAQAIHHNSPIRHKAFVTVNCPCLNHELLESDLFGHVRGSFTGAVQDTWGKVAAAEGGTLFLDEIGDLPMSLQPKLLRLLQEKQYERVGEAASRSANVRIIAATNRDLKREVAAGRFREDLFYRLNVIAIEVPPLRGRPLQILGSAEAFLETVCQQLGKIAPALSAGARRILEGYTWPGNLRELRNVVERAAILSNAAALDAADFPALTAPVPESQYQIGAPISLQALETAHIQMVVAKSSSLVEAARILEIDKSTLYRKRKLMESRVAEFSAVMDVRAAVAMGN
jgi:NtrC-family two-component system response regulator AlgB